MSRVRELRDALGDGCVGQQEPLDIDGEAVSIVVTPKSSDALCEALSAIQRLGLAALICGGGTRLGLGNPPRRADLLLSTSGLSGIVELDGAEGVLSAGAGTPLSVLREAAHAAGWQLPFDPPGATSTLGGALASAAVGPRFPSPRAFTLGLSIAGPDGTRTRFGGRVVKNVTGYDLVKVHVGACGSLGVLESAWVRLQPIPEAVENYAVRMSFEDCSEAWGRVLEASRLSSVRMAACDATSGEGDPLLAFELAGDAPAVAREAESLRKLLAVERDDSERASNVRDAQGRCPEGGIAVRLRSLPSQLPAVVDLLAGEGGRSLLYPHRSELFVQFEDVAGGRIDLVMECVARAAELGRGYYVVSGAPKALKERFDVFGFAESQRPLFENMKRAFDPEGTLNPGRFAGRL